MDFTYVSMSAHLHGWIKSVIPRSRYAVRIEEQWCYLCKQNNSDGMDSTQTNTVNMDTYINLLLAKKLISPQLTVKDARTIFVKINLDDDLFQQLNPDDTADGLSLDEWHEAIARLTLEHFSPAAGDATERPPLEPEVFAGQVCTGAAWSCRRCMHAYALARAFTPRFSF